MDGQWAHAGPNAAAAVGLHLAMPSGATLTIGTDGKVTVKPMGELAVDALLATFTVHVTVAGNVTATEMMVGSISLRDHVHGGVEPGGANTNPPTA